MTADDIDKFEDLLLFCCTNDRFKRAPVGRCVEMMPEATREFLKTIKSDDLKNIRLDYIQKAWL